MVDSARISIPVDDLVKQAATQAVAKLQAEWENAFHDASARIAYLEGAVRRMHVDNGGVSGRLVCLCGMFFQDQASFDLHVESVVRG